MLQLHLRNYFYNIIFKIKQIIYSLGVRPPPPSNKKFWVRSSSKKDSSWPANIGFTETSVTNYQPTPRSNPQVRKPSRKLILCWRGLNCASRDLIWGMLQWTLDWSLLVPFKATQVILVTNLCETTWRYENWIAHNRLCKCVGLISETVGRIGKQVHGQSMDRDFEVQ
jgi:hypothetical protein